MASASEYYMAPSASAAAAAADASVLPEGQRVHLNITVDQGDDITCSHVSLAKVIIKNAFHLLLPLELNRAEQRAFQLYLNANPVLTIRDNYSRLLACPIPKARVILLDFHEIFNFLKKSNIRPYDIGNDLKGTILRIPELTHKSSIAGLIEATGMSWIRLSIQLTSENFNTAIHCISKIVKNGLYFYASLVKNEGGKESRHAVVMTDVVINARDNKIVISNSWGVRQESLSIITKGSDILINLHGESWKIDRLHTFLPIMGTVPALPERSLSGSDVSYFGTVPHLQGLDTWLNGYFESRVKRLLRDENFLKFGGKRSKRKRRKSKKSFKRSTSNS